MQKIFVPDLSLCQNGKHLASVLGVDADLFAALASSEAAPFYRRHAIPKRSRHRTGEKRIVFEPATDELRQIHKTINRRLSIYACHRDPSFPPACCYGFVRNRSTLENADQHKGHPLLLRVDIGNFFPTISQARVADVLTTIGLNLQCAQMLSRVLCFTGSLVPGISASPLIANLVCRNLDTRLSDLAEETGSTYTRYADDIAFSGDAVPTLVKVARLLEAEGFSLAEKKQRLTKRGQAHFVTGLSIQDPARPHVPKKMKRKLRQELYYSTKYSIEDHLLRCEKKLGGGINRLDGMVRYVSHIEKDTAFDFRQRWEQLQARDDVSPSVGADHEKARRSYFVAVDESIIKSKGQSFLAVGFALYEDEQKINTTVDRVRDDYLADAFAPGKKGEIIKKGVHYADAHPELKAKFIERLPSLPMRVLVGVADLPSESSDAKAAAYLRVVRWAIRNIYDRTDRGTLKLLVEAAEFIVKRDVEDVIATIYTLRTAAGIIRPTSTPDVVFVGKECPAISLPDFMLGVLGTYVRECAGYETKVGASSIALGQFERLRDRFTLIHDLDTRRYYSRKKPFHANSLDDRSKKQPLGTE